MIELPRSSSLVVAVGVTIGLGVLFKVLRSGRWFGARRWVHVGHLSKLWIYPVKGLKGKAIKEAWCSEKGITNGEETDRQFLIMNANDKKYLSIKDEPKIVLIEPFIENDLLTLHAPDEQIEVDLATVRHMNQKVEIRMWNTPGLEGFDCGDMVGNWISRFLGKPHGSFRLLYHDPLNGGLKNERELRTYHRRPPGPMEQRKDLTLFSNATNFTLLCDKSLDDLNEKMDPSRPKFDSISFRPNFYVETTRKAFEEDNWSHILVVYITGESVEFSFMKPTHRCPVTTVNMLKGEKRTDGEPLATLRKYRQGTLEQQKLYIHSPMICINLANDIEGEVKLGDPVYAVID